MWQKVHVKFAESLSQKRAEARQRAVHVRLADALQRRQFQKTAGAAMVMAGLRHDVHRRHGSM